jgi:hypothetical protein
MMHHYILDKVILQTKHPLNDYKVLLIHASSQVILFYLDCACMLK